MNFYAFFHATFRLFFLTLRHYYCFLVTYLSRVLHLLTILAIWSSLFFSTFSSLSWLSCCFLCTHFTKLFSTSCSRVLFSCVRDNFSRIWSSYPASRNRYFSALLERGFAAPARSWTPAVELSLSRVVVSACSDIFINEL